MTRAAFAGWSALVTLGGQTCDARLKLLLVLRPSKQMQIMLAIIRYFCRLCWQFHSLLLSQCFHRLLLEILALGDACLARAALHPLTRKGIDVSLQKAALFEVYNKLPTC